MKIDLKKPIGPMKTVGGSSVRIVSINGHPDFPIVGIVDRYTYPVSWDLEGKPTPGAPAHLRLVESDVKIEVDIYFNGNGKWSSVVFDPNSDLKRCMRQMKDYVKTVLVEVPANPQENP